MEQHRGLHGWLQDIGFPGFGEPPRARMSNWLDPIRLAEVGLRAAISQVFGQFADRREGQAAVRSDHPDEVRGYIDRSEALAYDDGSTWIDYLADTGDGWNPTNAMARLLSYPDLQPAGCNEPLKRGQLLILGGDQVYPSATPEDYERRLIQPFRSGAQVAGGEDADKGGLGEIYAIPGNHDWYDGLRSFLGIFCRDYDGLERPGKVIGGRMSRQSRSYFAIKLPHNWWLWGLDSQLEGYIDQPQVDYFARVSKVHMDRDSRLIICTGYPSWTRVDPGNPNKRFGSFSYMERLINNYAAERFNGSGKVYLSISGDTHHYARHEEIDDEQNGGPASTGDKRHYVTCGGGGAYTHPTLQLQDEDFLWAWPRPGMGTGRVAGGKRTFKIAKVDTGSGQIEALYPSRADSKREAWKVLGLAFLNLRFTLAISAISAVLLWTMLINVPITYAPATFAHLGSEGPFDWLRGLWPLWQIASQTLGKPWVLLYFVTTVAIFSYAADTRNKRHRFLIGLLNASVQLAIVTVVGQSVLHAKQGASLLVSLPLAGLASGFAAATALGIYFLACFRLGKGMHWNEVFMSLRLTSYKSMLRLKIDREGRLTLYALGLRHSEQPKRWYEFWKVARVEPVLEPELIEPALNIS